MPTRNFDLTDRHDKMIEAMIASGGYEDANEVIRTALRLLEQQIAEDEAKLELLRSLADERFKQLDQGLGLTFESREDLATFISEHGRKTRSSANVIESTPADGT